MAPTRAGKQGENFAREPSVAYRVTVTGRVQGVGFRAWAAGSARRHGVYGWVKNAWSGDVELHVEGPESSVEAYLIALETGPSMSRVDAVRAEQTAPRGYAGFEVEYD